MISDNLREIVKNLSIQGKMLFPECATEEQILSFEKEHNISLPKQYKDWLQVTDGGECFLPAGVQFYGVSHKPQIDVDDSNRPNEKFVVIGALASGDPIMFEKGSEKISIYNQECGTIEDDEIYDDFYTFLNDLPDLLGIGD